MARYQGGEKDSATVLQDHSGRSPLARLPGQARGFSPTHVLAITIGGIFMAEIVAMVVIYLLPSLSYPVRTLIDAAIMTALIFPVVYFLSFRRLLRQMEREREATAALRQAYEQLQELETIVNRSPAVALVWNARPGWRVEYATQNIEQFDYRAQELVGRRDFADLIHPADLGRIATEVAAFSASGATHFGVEYRLFTGRGEVRWVEGRAWVRRDARGEVTHYYGILLDITERKQAEEQVARERSKLKSILDAMRDGVYIVDDAFQLEYVNPVIEEEFGPLTGRKCYEYLHDRSETCPWCGHLEVAQGRTVSREWSSAKTGRTYDLLDTPLRNADGSISMLKTLRDITERKQHEEQLEQTNRQLLNMALGEQEQRQLAEALAEATLSVSRSLDLAEVLANLLSAIQSAIPFHSAAVLLFEGEQTMVLRHRGANGLADAAASPGDPALFFEQYPFMSRVREMHTPQLVQRQEAGCCDGDSPGCESFCCYMVAPLDDGEMPAGALFLAREDETCFDEDDLARLVKFSSHAGLAINNARLFARKVRARQTADVLREASAALARSLDLDVVVETSLDFIRRLVPYDGAEIILLGSEGELMVRGRRGDWPWSTPAHLGRGKIELEDLPDLVEILDEMKTLVIADANRHPRWLPVPSDGTPLSCLVVPLISGGKAFGIYSLHKNETGFFTAAHVELAEALASLAAVAVQNAWLFEQVKVGSERLQSLTRRLAEIQESERLYIARELHDEAGQALTSLMVQLRLIEQVADRPEAVLARIAEMDSSLQGVIENLHRLAMALRPAALDHLGLEAAVRENAEAIAERCGMTIQVAPFCTETRLPRNVETILYRIVQEALNNVVRHAEASRVDIVFQTRDKRIIVVVEDNGIGFDPAAITDDEHLGLLGMRERAETLGGTLAIESRPGQGTTIVAEVPL